jgi:hypothetical protein
LINPQLLNSARGRRTEAGIVCVNFSNSVAAWLPVIANTSMAAADADALEKWTDIALSSPISPRPKHGFE